MATAGKTEGVFVLFRFGAGGEEIGGEEAEGVEDDDGEGEATESGCDCFFFRPFFFVAAGDGEGGADVESTGGGDDWESETGGRSEARDSKIFV